MNNKYHHNSHQLAKIMVSTATLLTLYTSPNDRFFLVSVFTTRALNSKGRLIGVMYIYININIIIMC